VGRSIYAGSGWAVGDGQEHGDDPAWDAVDADKLYDLLEREVIPEFYHEPKMAFPWMDQADAGKHGAVDTTVLRRPHGARVHRAALFAGGGCVLLASEQQR